VRVLVAEDNPVNQIVTTALLERAGCVLEVVSDGKKVVERALTRQFDLVLMDCHMPELDGFEATGQIRAAEARSRLPRLPIVALTANAVKGDRDKCLSAGMDDYLTKPIHMDRLIGVLSKLVKGAKGGAGDLAASSASEAAVPLTVAAPAGAAAGGSGGIDPVDVEAVLERCMGDMKVLEKVLGKFEEHLPETVKQLRSAVEEGEAKSVVRLAHAIKGAAANASAAKLQTLAAEIEQVAEFASLEKLRSQAESLAAEMKRCLAFVPSAMVKARTNAKERGNGIGSGLDFDLNALMRR